MSPFKLPSAGLTWALAVWARERSDGPGYASSLVASIPQMTAILRIEPTSQFRYFSPSDSNI